MTYIPTPQRTHSQKVDGEFYPLQKAELMALRSAKLINNTAYVHLALRFENPWCDRPVEVIPKEFALRWAIPENSVYKAVAKLKELGIIQIKSGKVVIEWNLGTENEFSEPTKNFPSGKKIFRADKNFSDQQKSFPSRQKQSAEPLSNLASSFPQTFQTIQTNQTRAGEKTFSEKAAINGDAINGQSQDEGNQLEQEVKQGEKLQEKNGLETIASVVEKIPRAVAQKATKTSQRSEIPQDLIDKLEELEIPLDDRVRDAIAKHHISQAYGAVTHIENTWSTINNPRGVFLFQLPRQPVEAMGTRGRVRTARDFGFTLADIQKMYGINWRDAAAHFGIEVPEEGEEVRSSEFAVRSCLASTPNSDEEETS